MSAAEESFVQHSSFVKSFQFIQLIEEKRIIRSTVATLLQMSNVGMSLNSGGDMSGINNLSPSKWCPGDTFVQRMLYKLKSGVDSDIKFIFNDKSVIRAHKFILSIHSAIFNNLFETDEAVTEFAIEDASADEFSLFLEYLYAGHHVKNVTDAFPLLKLAKLFQVPDIMRQSNQLLQEGITDENALGILQESQKYGDTTLGNNALEHIASAGFRILKNPQFSELEIENLKEILGRDDLRVMDELQIYNALIQWGTAEMRRQKMPPESGKYLRSVLEDLIYLVRFPLMDRSDYSKQVALAPPALRVLTEGDRIELRDYFDVDPDERANISIVFNTHPRLPYVCVGKEYVAQRLKFVPDTACLTLTTKQPTGYYYLPNDFDLHSIRFKVSLPIWISSIGLPCLATYSQYDSSANYEIKDVKKNVTLVSSVVVTPKGQSDGVVQIPLGTDVLIHPGKLYSASVRIISGTFIGGVCTSTESKTSIQTDDGTEVELEFFEDEPSTGLYTGLGQGHIPTFGFKTE